jgi:hypothetical protein
MGTLVGTAVSTAAWVGGSGVGVRSTVIEQAIVPSRSEPRIKRKAVRFIVPPILSIIIISDLPIEQEPHG